MNYSTKIINDVLVDPIKDKKSKVENILGWQLIALLLCNIFICGRKGSGKTNVTWTLLQHCIDETTKVIIFCPTCNSDSNWIAIRKWLEKRDQPHIFYESIMDDKNVSYLNLLMDKIKDDDRLDVEKAKTKKPKNKVTKILFDKDSDDENDENEGGKNKKVAPKYFIVFDDISDQLRKKGQIQTCLKIQRHLKAKVVISSQYPNDLDPASRAQIDLWCLFRGFTKNKMEDVFPQLDINNMDFEEFYTLYSSVTNNKDHNFLYINKNKAKTQLRENFNQEIIVKDKNI